MKLKKNDFFIQELINIISITFFILGVFYIIISFVYNIQKWMINIYEKFWDLDFPTRKEFFTLGIQLIIMGFLFQIIKYFL